MSKTMSSSNPNDQWMQFYNPNFSSQTSQPSQPPQQPQSATGISSPTAAPEGGRVVRPARRRTRASRRTPTTLLNTDTANFRAMVQQFTGGPAGPHGSSGQQSFSFGGAMARPTAAGYQTAAYYQQIQQQQQHQINQQGFPYTFGGGAVARPEAGGDGLFQRLNSGRAAEEGFLMGVGQPSAAAARPRGWSSEQ